MPPEVVLVGILPPLLYYSAFRTGLRELRRNLRPISLLAFGLVILTMVGVALVAHAITDLGWAEAFILGAVVSPTDPTAAAAIGRRLGVPRRLIDIVEGESLVNDGTALVLLRTAIVAAVAGSFSAWERGRPSRPQHRRWDRPRSRGRLRDPPRPASARQPAARGDDRISDRLPRLPAGDGDRRLGRARGRHRGRLHGLAHARADDGPDASARDTASGRSSTFLLNVLLFGLIGLQLRPILDGLSGHNGWSLVGDAAVICACGDPPAHRLGLPRDLPPPLAVPAHQRARPVAAVALPRLHRLERHARSGDDRGRAAHPPGDGQRRAAARPRPDRLLRVRGRARDAGRAGPVAARADPCAAPGGRRRRRRGGGAGAHPRSRGGARAPRRARGRGVGARRHRRAAARPVPVPDRPLLGAQSTPTGTARSRSGR